MSPYQPAATTGGGAAASGYWTVPRPLAVREVRIPDGAVIFLRKHGNPQGPRLVLSHCNGFAADTYYPFWSLLADRFDLVLYDFRNHGWNPVDPRLAHNIETFVRDNRVIVKAIAEYFGEKPMIGVFHSMSAVTAILQLAESDEFAALVVFDPPTCPHGRESQDVKKMAGAMASKARQRQDRFRNPDEFTEQLLRAQVYERLQPGVADLIARTTLRRTADRGTAYELCCPREYEANIYDQLYGSAVASEIISLPCPTKVIGADPVVPLSFLPSVDLSDMVALDYDFVPETTHFLQLEEPQECVDRTLDFLVRERLA